VLLGEGPDDLVECTLALGAQMLRRGGRAKSTGEARKLMAAALKSGRALATMEEVVRAQGGDRRVVGEPDRLPTAPHRVPVRAARSGYVRELGALEVGRACVALGAGRARAEDAIDPRVGVLIQKKPGDRVRAGDVLAEVHAADVASGKRTARAIEAAYRIASIMTVMTPRPLILGRRGA
jgi:thymidine phosphorylase